MGFVLEGGGNLFQVYQNEETRAILWVMILVLGSTEWKRLGKIRSRKTREQPETQTGYYAEACTLLCPFKLTLKISKAC